MDGPSGVVALVLAETAAGGAAVMWLAGLWGKVKRGFFILTGSTVFACALLAALAASAAATPAGGTQADLAVLLLWATTGLVGLSVGALALGVRSLGLGLGLLGIPVSIAGLVALARLADPSFAVAVLQIVAGAAFMGAVTDGLLLGHWYLVDRRLTREHIRRLTTLLLAAVLLEAAAVSLSAFGDAPPTPDFSVLLTASGIDTWLALGMVLATGLIGVLIRASLASDRARAVQAATGFFYLAVIFAFTAEMAAKVRFVG